ncbi:hypothetical protein N9Y92_00690 [Chlamydiales bacterium]|nr:hypothetical protein [Chlamydiales bacterium]
MSIITPMKAFDELITITESLLGDKGCPWDKKQTLQSLKKYVIEESHEVIEAIDLDDNDKIKDEVCDLFFNGFFLSRIAQKEGRFSTEEMLSHLNEKLIRRHPHVFGEAKIDSLDELAVQWDKIKNKEKGDVKTNLFDNIPKDLPPLAKAHRILDRLESETIDPHHTKTPVINDEESLGSALFSLVIEAKDKGLNAEVSLRKFLTLLEKKLQNS